MKKLIGLALYGCTLFAISAGVGWYLQQKALDDAAQATAEAQRAAAEAAAIQVTDLAKVKPVDAFGDPEIDEAVDPDQQMPVAVRPAPMTVEEVVRYGLGLKERAQAVQEREQALQEQERRQRLVLADIEGVQQEVEGLLIQARDQRVATQQLLKQVVAKKQELDAATQDDPSTPAGGKDSAAPDAPLPNLRAGIETFSGLEPEKAAGILKGYANDGGMDQVVQILGGMEDRERIKILEAIDDDQLNGEIIRQIVKTAPERKAPVRR
jgi:hypothetical protein